tara:strand:+ start:774 stop:1163 length:390 start_codon:yes stop_codon:yes gene_type:complete
MNYFYDIIPEEIQLKIKHYALMNELRSPAVIGKIINRMMALEIQAIIREIYGKSNDNSVKRFLTSKYYFKYAILSNLIFGKPTFTKAEISTIKKLHKYRYLHDCLIRNKYDKKKIPYTHTKMINIFAEL